MPAVERTTLIHAAPANVFDLISRVEDFSRYSRAIRSVRALGPDTYRWVIRVAGFEFDWDAVVTEKRRPEHFAWRSIRGVQNGGAFRLVAADGGTEVRFTMEYRLTNPILESIVNAVAAPLMQRVADELLAQVRARLESASTG